MQEEQHENIDMTSGLIKETVFGSHEIIIGDRFSGVLARKSNSSVSQNPLVKRRKHPNIQVSALLA